MVDETLPSLIGRLVDIRMYTVFVSLYYPDEVLRSFGVFNPWWDIDPKS